MKPFKKYVNKIKGKVKYFYQSIVYGYPDEDIWDLSNAVSCFVLPRLKGLALNYQGCIPFDMDAQKWRLILDDMVYAFEHTRADNRDYKYIDHKRVKKGLKYFGKYYNCLWF